MPFINLIAHLLAGCGLLYMGGKTIINKSEDIITKGFKYFVLEHANNPWFISFWGFITSASINSMSVILFAFGSLTSARVISFAQTYPAIIWANVGDVSYLYLGSFDMKIVPLIMLGILGIMFTFVKNSYLLHVIEGLIGVGFILLGISYTKDESIMHDYKDFLISAMTYLKNNPMLLILIGAVTRVILQSNFFLMILSMSLYNINVMTLNDIVILYVGLYIGKGIHTWLMSFVMTGSSIKIVYLEMLFMFFAAALMLIFNYIENIFGLTLMKGILSDLSVNKSIQVANLTFITVLVPSILFTLFKAPILHLFDKYIIVKEDEIDASKPLYIHEYNDTSPILAMSLCEKELLRLIKRLDEFIQGGIMIVSSQVLNKNFILRTLDQEHEDYISLDRYISQFLDKLMESSDVSPEILMKLININDQRLTWLALENNLYQILKFDFNAILACPNLKLFCSNVFEVSQFYISTLVDIVENAESIDIETIKEMNEHSTQYLEIIHEKFIPNLHDEINEKDIFLDLSIIFSKMMWLIQRNLSLLEVRSKLSH